MTEKEIQVERLRMLKDQQDCLVHNHFLMACNLDNFKHQDKIRHAQSLVEFKQVGDAINSLDELIARLSKTENP